MAGNLVLDRRDGEEIVLYTASGERVVVKLYDPRGQCKRFKVAINAPKTVRIVRGELEEAA